METSEKSLEKTPMSLSEKKPLNVTGKGKIGENGRKEKIQQFTLDI